MLGATLDALHDDVFVAIALGIGWEVFGPSLEHVHAISGDAGVLLFFVTGCGLAAFFFRRPLDGPSGGLDLRRALLSLEPMDLITQTLPCFGLLLDGCVASPPDSSERRRPGAHPHLQSCSDHYLLPC